MARATTPPVPCVIISVLSGATADWQPKPSVRAEDSLTAAFQ